VGKFARVGGKLCKDFRKRRCLAGRRNCDALIEGLCVFLFVLVCFSF
jgi:hypothetical protein